MRSLAIINQKGGVGKTTTAVNLAAGLARLSRRVLLVDLDPQSHASLHVGVQIEPGQPGMYEVLIGSAALAEVARDVSDCLSVAGSTIDLVAAEIELLEHPGRERILAEALARYREAFDFCIIDCPPSLGLLTINALTAVHEVVIPLQAHFLALQGLGRLLETVSLVRQTSNPALRVAGVLLCMFERGTRLAQEVSDDVAAFLAQAGPDDPWFGACLFKTAIRRNVKLAECPSFGKTIFDYAGASHGAEDYLELARDVLAAGPRSLSAETVEPRVAVAPDAELREAAAPAGATDAVPIATSS
ncbi:Soj-like protein [Phycisphaerae bacterium RAS1]|nr:Soj-like protein [Phycisphaerae bacterium RAS1]